MTDQIITGSKYKPENFITLKDHLNHTNQSVALSSSGFAFSTHTTNQIRT